MAEPPSLDLWADLRSRRPSFDDALETVPVAGTIAGAMYGMGRQGELHLLLPVEGPPAGPQPPDLRGPRVRHRQLSGRGEYLDLVAAACYHTIFSALCAEVLTAITEQHRKPWEAVFSTLRAWQTAWKASSSAMERTVQIGLYGELLVLEHIVIPALGARAILHWSGPDAERHDFVGSGAHLEVKTTRRRRHEHEISRVDQLAIPAGRRLLLASLLLEESAMGTETLATRIDAVAGLVRADALASDLFQTKLVQIGWSEEMRRTGELVRFHLGVESLIVPVEGHFPRLPDGFALPPGIVALRYTVDLANLPGLDMSEAVVAVREGFSEIPTT